MDDKDFPGNFFEWVGFLSKKTGVPVKNVYDLERLSQACLERGWTHTVEGLCDWIDMFTKDVEDELHVNNAQATEG